MVQLLPCYKYSLEIPIVQLKFTPLSALVVPLSTAPWITKELSTNPLLLYFLPCHIFSLHCKKPCGSSYLKHSSTPGTSPISLQREAEILSLGH